LLAGTAFADNAADSRPPGPKINSTVTSVEEQQKDQKRPKFRQPTDVSDQPISATKLPLSPVKGERLVFIGNGLAERMQHFGHFETLLHQRFPNSEITFRNMGFLGHTPGFRPEAGQPNPWAFPEAEQFHPDINAHHGKGHYPTPDEWLTIIEADTIVAFFGFNESFHGTDGLARFRDELAAFIDHTRRSAYNGKSALNWSWLRPLPWSSTQTITYPLLTLETPASIGMPQRSKKSLR